MTVTCWRPISEIPEHWRPLFCDYACSGMIPTECARTIRHFYAGGDFSVDGKAIFHLPATAIRNMYLADIEPFEMGPLQPIPSTAWGDPGRDQIQWEASCWMGRSGEPNHQQRQIGTDLIDIRFDEVAARDCGCPIEISPGTGPAERRQDEPVPQRRPPSPTQWDKWVRNYKSQHNPLPDVDRVILADAKAAFPNNSITQAVTRRSFGGQPRGPRPTE